MRSGVFYSVLCGVIFIATNAHGAEYESVTIRVGAEADAVELKVAELLRQRIAEPSDLPTRVERTVGDVPKNSLLILLGIPRIIRSCKNNSKPIRFPLSPSAIPDQRVSWSKCSLTTTC